MTSTLDFPAIKPLERQHSSSPRPDNLPLSPENSLTGGCQDGCQYDGVLLSASPKEEEEEVSDPSCQPSCAYVGTPIDADMMDLIDELGSKDPYYTGVMVFNPCATDPKKTVYSPFQDCNPPRLAMDGSPNLRGGLVRILSHGLGSLGVEVYKDGKASASDSSRPAIWTLRLTKGTLYVFQNGRVLQSPYSEPIPADPKSHKKQFYHSKEVICIGSPGFTLKPFVDNHENDGQVLVLDERENRSVHVIRHDVYYLVLELDKSPPALTTWSESKLKQNLDQIKRDKKTLEEAKINPFINIGVASTQGLGCCNMAFYFITSSHYHFVHIDEENNTSFIKCVERVEGEIPDITPHLQFSDSPRNHGGGGDDIDGGGKIALATPDPSTSSSDANTPSSNASGTDDSQQTVESGDSGFATSDESAHGSVVPPCNKQGCTIPGLKPLLATPAVDDAERTSEGSGFEIGSPDAKVSSV